ncbi:unnamed protein product [Nippostrongylus brasiliensis]|uniref:Serpentine receptor class gamma n=1 Tax=Nippostrongylus brasiliensis TaxID=27835 RepID=A0A0N4XMG7_NIPBR|nr:unnamed protein product [Nippostrongylus brasiliensis]
MNESLFLLVQGVIDITVMISYFFFGTIRHSMVLSHFFWTYQSYYVASWCFTHTYVTVILRCFGVLLLSFQRYLSVCRYSGRLQRLVNESHRWVLPSLQFTVPILYSIPLLTITDVSFFAPDLLEVRVDKEKITVGL